MAIGGKCSENLEEKMHNGAVEAPERFSDACTSCDAISGHPSVEP